MSSAGGAAKALQVEHFGLGSHHKVVFGENILASRAAGGVKPEIGEKIVILLDLTQWIGVISELMIKVAAIYKILAFPDVYF